MPAKTNDADLCLAFHERAARIRRWPLHSAGAPPLRHTAGVPPRVTTTAPRTVPADAARRPL
jgi:hypothetical protein